MNTDLEKYRLKPSSADASSDISKYKLQGASASPLPATAPEAKPQGILSRVSMTPFGSWGRSAKALGGGLLGAVAHPVQTVKTLADVLGGGIQVGAEKLGIESGEPDDALRLASGGDAVDHEQQKETFRAVAGFFKDRYGSLEGFLKAGEEDPVGVVADFSSVLGGAGALTTKLGKASKVAELANAGKNMSTAAKVIDPVNAAGEVMSATKGKVLGGGKYRSDVAKDASDLGVELPASALTDSKVVQGTEALLGRGLFGGKINEKIRGAVQKLKEVEDAATSRVNQAIQDATRSYTDAPMTPAKDVGTVVKESFENLKETAEAHRTALYDAVPPEVKSAPAILTNTENAVSDVLAQMNKAGAVTPAGKGVLEKIASDIADSKPRPRTETLKEQYARQGSNRGALETVMDPPKRPMSFEELKAMRTEVGKMLNNRVDPVSSGIKSQLEYLYKSLSEDMEATAKAVSPEADEAFKAANAANAKLMSEYNGKVAKMIAKANPEQIVDLFLRKNNESSIEAVRQVAGQEAVDQLGAAFTNKLFNNSRKDGIVDVNLLKKKLAEYEPGTIDALLGSEATGRLNRTIKHLESYQAQAEAKFGKIDAVRKALRAGTKTADGSQTAFLFNLGGTATALGTGIVQMDPSILMAVVGKVMGEAVATKFFTSQLGQDFMTKGVTLQGKTGNLIMQKAGVVTPASRVETAATTD